jgi:hypothetical protein
MEFFPGTGGSIASARLEKWRGTLSHTVEWKVCSGHFLSDEPGSVRRI